MGNNKSCAPPPPVSQQQRQLTLKAATTASLRLCNDSAADTLQVSISLTDVDGEEREWTSSCSVAVAPKSTLEIKDGHACSSTSCTNLRTRVVTKRVVSPAFREYMAMALYAGLPTNTDDLNKYHLNELNKLAYCARAERDPKLRQQSAEFCGQWKSKRTWRKDVVYNVERLVGADKWDYSDPERRTEASAKAWEYMENPKLWTQEKPK